MKTKLLALTILLALASCERETIETPTPGGSSQTIGFTARDTRTMPDGSTRGELITTPADIAGEGGFVAWTYAHTGTWALNDIYIGNPGDGIAVTSGDGGATWDYGIPKLWPKGKTVTSFAIAPADAVVADNTSGGAVVTPAAGAAPTVSYVLPAPGSSQHDLMFATEVTFPAGTVPVDGIIPKSFHHALARVSIKIFKEEGLEDVVVSNVTLSDLFNEGTASVDAPVSWLTTDTPKDHIFTPGSGLVSGEISDTAIDAGSAQSILDPGFFGEALFMLPQTLGGDRLDITYSIEGGSAVTESLPIPLPDGATGWEPGGNYTIILGIRGEVEPFVETFDSDSSTVWTVPEEGYYYIEAWGGDGGDGYGGATGGKSQPVEGLYLLSAGETLNVYIGGAGTPGARGSGSNWRAGGTNGSGSGSGGYGGGGGTSSGSAVSGGDGGGGGAATFILKGGNSTPIIASGGGGGGGGRAYANTETAGGNGGNGGMANSTGGAGGAGAGNGAGTAGAGQSSTTNGANSWAGQNGAEIIWVPYAAGAGGGGGGGGYDRGGNPGGNGSRSSFGSAGGGGGGVGGSSYLAGTAPGPVPSHIDAPGRIDITGGKGYPDLSGGRPTGRDGYVIISFLGPATQP